MRKRQFYTIKVNSSDLKHFKYSISDTFAMFRKRDQIAPVADGQVLRTIREITNKNVDLDEIERLYQRRDYLKRQNSTHKNAIEIANIQKMIYDIMFIPEYVTVTMSGKKQYERIFNKGFELIIDGRRRHYQRLSCSAGQARDSTVVFCDSDIIDELETRLDNGRDKNYKIAPSKFNAYFGLYTSATTVVSEPKFCVVPDYENRLDVMVNYVTETDYDSDDLIDTRMVNLGFNRTDGMGLINYERASIWAKELDLDYVPAQFCVRQSFIKGMLCTFPIQEFCELVNDGCYTTTDIYGAEIDLRDYDVILTESQFKLWGAYPNLDYYKECCHKNNLQWGVAICTPKHDKDIIKMNYQFLQTLDLSNEDIESMCKMFVDWIQHVTCDNIGYTLLYLVGEGKTEEELCAYMNGSDNYWIKSLIMEPELIRDRYIKQKIYNLIKKRIQDGCLGEIILRGNFQVLVSDPYAFMQHVCGIEPTGLLGANEYYSNYWNERDVKVVDGMRSPLTYRSEHVKMNLATNSRLEFWYRYCYTGIIVNYHGHETMNWGGSDYDYDILATTDCQEVINGIYPNELPVYYEPPKPMKIVPTKKDLFESDTFSFGSIIGSITNKGSSGYALLSDIEHVYGKNSIEYVTTLNRLKMSCKLQSAQIDKAKIGRDVKGIPKIWVKRQKIEEDDDEQTRLYKERFNYLCLDRHPYFFIYRYADTRRKYRNHMDTYRRWCKSSFRMTLEELLSLEKKSPEQVDFLTGFFKYMPVIDSDSTMNRLCHYIEGINMNVRSHLKVKEGEDMRHIFVSDDIEWNEERYQLVVEAHKKYCKECVTLNHLGQSHFDFENSKGYDFFASMFIGMLYSYINEVCSNVYEAIAYLAHYMYVERDSANKEMLWQTYAQEIHSIIKSKNNGYVLFPMLDEDGDIEYLGRRYSMKEVKIDR